MTRRITATFHGYDQPDVIVTHPDDHEHAGEHRDVLRVWAVDDETGYWRGMADNFVGVGLTYRGLIHQDRLRRDGNLTDDGLLEPRRVA